MIHAAVPVAAPLRGGERPTWVASPHPLPVEIISVILRLAAATSPATEVLQWLCLCRAAHSWTAPILYANVFIRSMYHLHLFHDALARHPIRGRWVRALWITGGGKQQQQQTPANPQPSLLQPLPPLPPPLPPPCTQGYSSRPRSLSISTTAPTPRRSSSSPSSASPSPWTRNPSFPLLSNDTARDPTFDLVHILQHCASLRHLAIVGCPLLPSALQVAAYAFRLHTLLLDPPISLKFRCMPHLAALRVLRIVGIPAGKLDTWRDWCGEVRALQRLRTLELELVVHPADRDSSSGERKVVSIDKPAVNKEPIPSLATTTTSILRVNGNANNGERRRETIDFPSRFSPGSTASASATASTPASSGTSSYYRDNEFYHQWTTDRAEETAASCLDF